jgi:RNA polymerase sigma factor (sigma-70 family)
MGLVSFMRQGDAVEFEEQRTLLTAIAQRTTGNREDALDVVQDVWIRYHAHREEVDCPQGWFRTVTSRAAIDVVRARSTRAEVPLYETSDLMAREDEPSERLVEREHLEAGVRRLLTCLSPLERVAFVGREFCDLTYRELAERVGRSEAAVRQLNHRASRHLRHGERRFPVTRGEVHAVLHELISAGRTGRCDDLLRCLAPDVLVPAA